MSVATKAAQAAKEAASINAILAAQAENEIKIAKAADRKAFVLGEAARLGRERGRGDTSLTLMCMMLNNATRLGAMGPDDANEVYALYSGGYDETNETAHVMMGEDANIKVSARGDSLLVAAINAEDAKEKDRIKVATSLVRTFAKPGAVAQGEGWFDRVRLIRDAIEVTDRLHSSMFNAWVAANRVANDAEGEVTDAMLIAALTVSAKAAKKTAYEKLVRLANDAAKLAKSNGADFAGLAKVAEVLERMAGAAKLGIKMDVTATSTPAPVVPDELIKAADVTPETKH